MHGIDKAHMLIFCLFLAMVFSGPGLNAQVRISELMYHPGDPGHEFLELVNTGSSAEDLSGWGVITGIDYVFPPGTTLAPGERLVVCKDRAALSAATGIASSTSIKISLRSPRCMTSISFFLLSPGMRHGQNCRGSWDGFRDINKGCTLDGIVA